MKRTLAIAIECLLLPLLALAAVKVGEEAPNFTGVDSKGVSHSVSEYKGKYVVLEWHNNGCPFVRKHYDSGNMQKLQKEWTAKGVVWLTVISSAPGMQGYVTPEEENANLKKENAAPTAVIMDPKGDIGHLYNAKTTPQMFVIAPDGKLIYDGAIDDHPSTNVGDIPGAKNYLSEALGEAMSGKPISNSATRPYGCSVKYAN